MRTVARFAVPFALVLVACDIPTVVGQSPRAPSESADEDGDDDNDTGDGDDNGGVVRDPREEAKTVPGTSSDIDSTEPASTETAPPATPGLACAATMPINLASVRYTPSRPRTAACTSTELRALADYFTAHVPNHTERLADWRALVSVACGQCALGQANESTAAPILLDGDRFRTVNSEGCFETVSGSTECGRRWAEVRQCITAACTACKGSEQARCMADRPFPASVCEGAMSRRDAACAVATPEAMRRCSSGQPGVLGPLTVVCGI